MSESVRWSRFHVPLAVAAGGAVGAVLRYAFTIGFPTDRGAFPLTTFAENVIGAFLLGFAIVIITERLRPTRLVQPFLCIGALGSFTTFSNFSMEMLELAMNGRTVIAALYASSSIAAGLLAAMFGMALAHRSARLRRNPI